MWTGPSVPGTEVTVRATQRSCLFSREEAPFRPARVMLCMECVMADMECDEPTGGAAGTEPGKPNACTDGGWVISRPAMMDKAKRVRQTGQLRIGDTWNAITIIALSQNNPLKAIAEFVENSIDAHAKNVTIVRGREGGKPFLRITDDGDGVPRDAEGNPDFAYVATHVCDSIKRRMKEQGATGLQGEFGIGLLSFWTVGEELTMTSSGADGHVHQMRLVKDQSGYYVSRRHMLLPDRGTELMIAPLLPGIRQLSGEKIQWYLASELRDRIRNTGVNIRVIDRIARKECKVEPRQYTGRILHDLPLIQTPMGDVYTELYLTAHDPNRRVSLYRTGTRVLDVLAQLDRFNRDPWTSGYLEGLIDVPFLQLTPGTRDGIIQDERYEAFTMAVSALEVELVRRIDEQREAEEQRASREVLKSVQKAIREALLALPAEEYDWFDIQQARDKPARAPTAVDVAGEGAGATSRDESAGAVDPDGGEALLENPRAVQKEWFEHEGPLHSVRIAPTSTIVAVNSQKSFRALPRDRSARRVERDLQYDWHLIEGSAELGERSGECVTLTALAEPGLLRLGLIVRQGDVECRAEALVTVTASVLEAPVGAESAKRGIPGYTYQKAPGELWRSRYDGERNVVVVNNGHRDFVFASRNQARKLRYLTRLFAKELILKNFPGTAPDPLLERMIELTLYTEENLK